MWSETPITAIPHGFSCLTIKKKKIVNCRFRGLLGKLKPCGIVRQQKPCDVAYVAFPIDLPCPDFTFQNK